MNKYIDRIQKQALKEVTKGGLVIVGAVSGMILTKGLDKLTENDPTLNAVVKYGMPLVLGGSGFIMTSATEENSKVKYLGYGLEAAAFIEGIKLIPVVGDYLNGILGNTEIPAANAFLTENEDRERLMQGFGMLNLPIGKAVMQDTPAYETNLPSLNENEDNKEDDNDLGYSGSITEDSDQVSGIL
jgi:hypothetical protein